MTNLRTLVKRTTRFQCWTLIVAVKCIDVNWLVTQVLAPEKSSLVATVASRDVQMWHRLAALEEY